ncbi:hypothetical protein Hanom_Chr04g00379791 [Helianthus anomalus]
MNRTDPIFRVVNRFCILCLIGSRVGSGNGRVGSGFSFCSPLLLNAFNLQRAPFSLNFHPTTTESYPGQVSYQYYLPREPTCPQVE